MHNTRGQSCQQHSVVLGNVTAALAGHWAASTPLSTKVDRFLRSCDNMLPHDQYKHKVNDRPIYRDLRLENVYAINLDSHNPAKRTGRYVHDAAYNHYFHVNTSID